MNTKHRAIFDTGTPKIIDDFDDVRFWADELMKDGCGVLYAHIGAKGLADVFPLGDFFCEADVLCRPLARCRLLEVKVIVEPVWSSTPVEVYLARKPNIGNKSAAITVLQDVEAPDHLGEETHMAIGDFD